jgi:pimeloyl-ACP methyl ester carboxylesterase
MGGDISVFEEDQLERDLDILCKNESLVELFNRSLSGMIEVLVQPKRYNYDSYHLKCDKNECSDYAVDEFLFRCDDGVALNCAKWVKDASSDVCVIYTHTNMRSLADAVEILPICNLLKANLLAYDMRGCGKSAGSLSLLGSRDLSCIVKGMVQANPNLQVILWARGISTHMTIELLSSSQQSLPNIKFVVLDSPFTSLDDVVSTAAAAISTYGITVPSVFVKFAVQMMRRNVKKQLGCDPYAVKPVLLATRISIPCFVLAADDDEYIPLEMGDRVSSAWGGPCSFREFPASHFSERDECVVLTPLEKILKCIGSVEEAKEGGEPPTKEESADTARAPAPTIMDSDGGCVPCTPPPKKQGGGEGEVRWIPDSAATFCVLCAEEFSLLRRKHHCRKCGGVVCDACSLHRLVLGGSGVTVGGTTPVPASPSQPVRVCDACNNLHYLSL